MRFLFDQVTINATHFFMLVARSRQVMSLSISGYYFLLFLDGMDAMPTQFWNGFVCCYTVNEARHFYRANLMLLP